MQSSFRGRGSGDVTAAAHDRVLQPRFTLRREERAMNLIEADLPGVLIIEPKVFGDERGFFMESWNGRRYEEAGLPGRFVQDNLSYSKAGVLRGLHFQNPNPQGKLVSVLRGEEIGRAHV